MSFSLASVLAFPVPVGVRLLSQFRILSPIFPSRSPDRFPFRPSASQSSLLPFCPSFFPSFETTLPLSLSLSPSLSVTFVDMDRDGRCVRWTVAYACAHYHSPRGNSHTRYVPGTSFTRISKKKSCYHFARDVDPFVVSWHSLTTLPARWPFSGVKKTAGTLGGAAGVFFFFCYKTHATSRDAHRQP